MESPGRLIELSPPMLGDRERELMAEALAMNRIAAGGPHLERFERDFAASLGLPHAVAVSSGTAALHLAVRCLDLRPGDEVLCSTLTFAASAFPIAYERARPVFVDCEPGTGNISPALLGEEIDRLARLGRPPRAVIGVDLLGEPADWEAIIPLCRRHDVAIIEDAAQALGATRGGRPAGSSGWANAFSFNGNKIITAAGGGMLATASAPLADRARSLASQAKAPGPGYDHPAVGYNYRMGNLQAALGLAQFGRLADRVEARRRVFEGYRERLGAEPGLAFPPEGPGSTGSRWLTWVRVDPSGFGATAEEVRLRLVASGIEARPLWKPLHLQPAFAGCRVVGGCEAEAIHRLGLCLPSGPDLGPPDLDRVADAIRSTPRATPA